MLKDFLEEILISFLYFYFINKEKRTEFSFIKKFSYCFLLVLIYKYFQLKEDFLNKVSIKVIFIIYIPFYVNIYKYRNISNKWAAYWD